MYMDASDGAVWSLAVMTSPLFPPLKIDVNDDQSPYYKMCKVIMT